MAVDERKMHDLYTGLEEWLGTDRSDTLMTLLPPADWNWHDVATKQDLTQLRADLEGQITGTREALEGQIAGTRDALESQIAGTRDALEGQISGLRMEFKTEIAEVRNELKEDMRGLHDRYTGLEGKFNLLRQEVSAEVTLTRAELMADFREKFEESTRTILITMVGSIVALISAMTALLAWVVK